MKQLVFATTNEGKMKEIRMMLKDRDVLAKSLKDLDLHPDIVEDGKTFEENALIKARALSKITGLLTLADDSGLEVDYMDKQPGIYSARWMGEDTPYSEKNAAIIKNLENARGKERSARFVCAIAAVLPDGTEYVTRATIEGEIAYEERGKNGFGYDPILYVPEYDMTTGEMLPEDKNKISHRGKALRQMADLLVEKGVI